MAEFLDGKAVSVADFAGEWKASKPDGPAKSFSLKTDPEEKGHMSAVLKLGHSFHFEQEPARVTVADGKTKLQAAGMTWSIQMRSDRKSLRLILLQRRHLRQPRRHGCEFGGTVAVHGSLRAALSHEEKRRRRSTKTIDVYTVPIAKEFGPCERRHEVEGFGPTAKTSKFKRDIPAGGPMPLKLRPDPRGDETAFWVRGPASLGPERRSVEIEPIPFVVCGEAADLGSSLEEAEKSLACYQQKRSDYTRRDLSLLD